MLSCVVAASLSPPDRPHDPVRLSLSLHASQRKFAAAIAGGGGGVRVCECVSEVVLGSMSGG